METIAYLKPSVMAKCHLEGGNSQMFCPYLLCSGGLSCFRRRVLLLMHDVNCDAFQNCHVLKSKELWYNRCEK